MGVGVTECFRCGTTEEFERFGNAYICADCTPGGNDTTGGDRFDTTGEHENPIDVSDVANAERADMLSEYLERFVDEFGSVPRLMTLDDEGKSAHHQGVCQARQSQRAFVPRRRSGGGAPDPRGRRPQFRYLRRQG